MTPTTSLTRLLWICFTGVASVVLGSGASPLNQEKRDKPADKGDLFTGSNVWRMQIEISRAGIAALRGTAWGNGQFRPKVKATVREGGVVYTNVAVHLKGAAGSFRPIDDHPCLTLNFDKYVTNQNFHGLHKLSLNNSVQDPSYLSERICRELFEAAGVPVPRATHAKVELNGRNLGLCVLTEGFNKQFLKRYFKNTKGNLYDGGFVQDITEPLAVNSGDKPQDNSGLRALASAAREQDPTQRLAQLEQTLDLDRFLSFIAMEVMQCHWDGYAMNRNNWRAFHDLGSNKIVFFPHGLDQMFGVERTDPQCRILPGMQGLVARAVVSTPEGRRRYLERMAQLYTNVFKVDAILQRVDQLQAQIRPVIAEANPGSARYHDEMVRWLKTRIVQRGESLRSQLASTTRAPRFEPGKSMRLSGWKPRVQSGGPGFQEQRQPEGRALLYINASGGNTIASWRTTAVLEPGRYRFEGKIRTKDVKPLAESVGTGAGLRIHGGSIPAELSGTNESKSFAYEFYVQDGASDVEFVCELRASKGEAWFDGASLRVIRLP